MSKGKHKEAGEAANALSVETWQDGYRQGTGEAFEWCIQMTSEMGKKAKTQEGKTAAQFLSELMRKEITRRQPPGPVG